MHTKVLLSADLNRAIMLRSYHQRNAKRSKPSSDSQRSESVYNTKSYRDSLQRAFNKAKEQIYFNPDMTNFVTLTYKENMQSIEQCLKDVKQLIKYETRKSNGLSPAGSGRTKAKYIFIMEYQKRGALHVHMIANNFLSLQVNKNGYPSLKYWTKGFSSHLQITDLDENFRPHLYLFKYMKKSQRIGKSFIHSSRNLTNYTELTDSQLNLIQWRTINMEYTQATIETTEFHYFKNYLQFDDTIELPTNNQGNLNLWHEQVKSHSTRELQKLVRNHSRR